MSMLGPCHRDVERGRSAGPVQPFSTAPAGCVTPRQRTALKCHQPGPSSIAFAMTAAASASMHGATWAYWRKVNPGDA